MISFLCVWISADRKGESVKKKIVLLAILGLSAVLAGCGNDQREKVVKSINELQETYQQAQTNIPESRQKDYELLGESIQALTDLTDKDSGELETEEELTEAENLVDEFYIQLNELTSAIEETEEVKAEDQVDFAVTFRNDSQENLASLSVKEPESQRETELDSFESGKRIETTVTVDVEELTFTWYLYNDVGECVLENTSSFVDAKEGIIIYYTEDGVFTESY